MITVREFRSNLKKYFDLAKDGVYTDIDKDGVVYTISLKQEVKVCTQEAVKAEACTQLSDNLSGKPVDNSAVCTQHPVGSAKWCAEQMRNNPDSKLKDFLGPMTEAEKEEHTRMLRKRYGFVPVKDMPRDKEGSVVKDELNALVEAL